MNEHLLNFKGLMIDEFQWGIIRENQEIKLTYTEFEILKLLGKLQYCHEHIRNIQEKIEDNPSKPIYIQTVWGVGYRFNKNLSRGL